MITKETLNIQKQSLRTRMRELMGKQSADDFAAHQERIVSREIWTQSSTVLLYSALSGEPDPITLTADGTSHRFVYPCIEGSRLGLYRHTGRSRWSKGPFGVKEPDPETWEEVWPGEIDLAFIPGLAFDREGVRLGRGAGFYDRLMGHPDFRGVKIGLCWEWQLIPSVPREPHDILMDLIISEQKTVL